MAECEPESEERKAGAGELTESDSYITFRLSTSRAYAHRSGSTQPHLLRPRRPDPARGPHPPRARRGDGQGAVGALSNERARSLEAPAGARACRAHPTRPSGAVATPNARSHTPSRSRRVRRRVPPLLGAELRSTGRAAGGGAVTATAGRVRESLAWLERRGSKRV